MAPSLTDTTTSDDYSLDGLKMPSNKGPVVVESSIHAPSTKASVQVSTTWLKLNSTAPIHIRVEDVTPEPENLPFSGAKKLRHILENTDELIVCPGVYDGLSARTAIELNFKALYMVSRSPEPMCASQLRP